MMSEMSLMGSSLQYHIVNIIRSVSRSWLKQVARRAACDAWVTTASGEEGLWLWLRARISSTHSRAMA